MKRIGRLFPNLMLLALLVNLFSVGLAQADATNRKIVVFSPNTGEDRKFGSVREEGGAVLMAVPMIHAVAANLSPQAEQRLRGKPEVLRIDDDIQVEALGKPGGGAALASQVTPWGIDKILASSSWLTSTGTGVKVGIIDTGISTSHPDLKVAGGGSFVAYTRSFNDDNGHGSHVAGIVGATNNSIGVVGVAPNVSLYAVKVLDRNGRGYLSDVINGLNWSAANGLKIVNMSLGSTVDNQSFHEAVTKAHDAGITIVAAAGNSGPGANTVNYPAKYSEVIAVSAIDQSGKIASWSSNGAEVDLAAPGVSIYSTYKGSKYATLSGTSMASPHVAGVAALRIAIDANTTPDHIMAVLKNNADSLGLTPAQQGAGMVNAFRVVTAQ